MNGIAIGEIIQRAVRVPMFPSDMTTVYYVAGPMRGYDKWNFPAFDEARDLLLMESHRVISPADLDRVRGFSETMTEFDQESFAVAMTIDLTAITVYCTHLYMMKGWSASVGAVNEFRVALATGKTIRFAPDAEQCFHQPDMLVGAE